MLDETKAIELKMLYENRDSYVRIGRNLTGKFWQEYRKKRIDPIERQIEELENAIKLGRREGQCK